MNETVTKVLATGVRGDLARKDVTELAKGIAKLLVVNSLGQVLDENIANSGLAKSRVTVRPHDAARTTMNELVVHGIQSALSVVNTVEVNVRVTQGAAGVGVAADPDGGHLTNVVEHLKEKSFGNIGSEVTDVKRRRSVHVRRNSVHRHDVFFFVFFICFFLFIFFL